MRDVTLIRSSNFAYGCGRILIAKLRRRNFNKFALFKENRLKFDFAKKFRCKKTENRPTFNALTRLFSKKVQLKDDALNAAVVRFHTKNAFARTNKSEIALSGDEINVVGRAFSENITNAEDVIRPTKPKLV